MANVQVIQRHAHLAAPVTVEFVNGKEGRIAKATLVAARRGQSELDELIGAGLISRRDHAERRAAFQRQVITAEAALRGPAGEIARDALADLAILNAQKAALLDAGRRSLISDDVVQARVNIIDRELMSLSDSKEGSK